MEISKEYVLEELKTFSLLFVEDEISSRKVGEIIFKGLFKEIVIAENGEQAIEILKTKQFDLVITDLRMPKIDGFEVVKFVKTHSPDTFVLILSALFDKDTLLKAIEVDSDGFLIKPFDMKIFIDTMRNLLSYKLKTDEEINILKQYKDIVDENLIVSKTDINGKIIYVNKKFEEISGFKEAELLGKSHNIIRHQDVPDEVFKEVWQTITNKKTWKGLIKNRKKNGETYYVESVIKPILDKHGNILEFIALRKDVTNYISAEKLIEDKLQILDKALLVLVKIENFNDAKLVYDDEVLTHIKTKLLKRTKNLLKDNFQYIEEYWINDEIFGFLIEDYKKDDLEDILNKLVLEVNNTPIIIQDMEYYSFIRVSFTHGKVDLYKDAMLGFDEFSDMEQRVISSNGLSIKKRVEIIKNMETLKMVDYALHNNRIVSLFQPIVSNDTQEIIKYESLVRIRDREGNLISPFFFLDIAKKAGVYGNITLKVLENSFEMYKEKNVPISINISPSDILRDKVRDKIISLLKQYNPKPGMITFELLEDEIIEYPKILQEFINNIKDLNAQIAIDDFGEGYSNFSRVVDVKADWIKIDGSLIKDIDKDPVRQDIVETIVNFAKKENKKTVAEFVENESIFKVLKKLGVDYSQGYYFSKPIEIDEILKRRIESN